MLVLPIKKKWFYMILTGEKREEYRDVKPYYTTRLNKIFNMVDDIPLDYAETQVRFTNGYGYKVPAFIADCHLEKRTGRKEWGAVCKNINVLKSFIYQNTMKMNALQMNMRQFMRVACMSIQMDMLANLIYAFTWKTVMMTSVILILLIKHWMSILKELTKLNYFHFGNS